jgi:hypothetical protein
MSPPIARSLWNMTPYNTELKTFAKFRLRTTQSRSKSKVHWMPWIIISYRPLVATLNWCREKCVAKASWNWRHESWLMSWYNISPTIMGWIPFKGLFMVKKRATPRICAIRHEMWPCAIWEQSWNNYGNPLVVLQPHFWKSVKMTLTLPKWGLGSPPRLPKLQSSIAGVKTPCLNVFFMSLESSWNVDVENGLAWAIWTFATQIMAKRKAWSQIDILTLDH